MKKSFKKAGAAVLSMAMLLSMGAVSMPAYAATTSVPGHISVTIANTTGSYVRQGEGDGYGTDDEYVTNVQDATERYDYLKLAGVTSATVTMYRVATLTGTDGWKWETYTDSEGNEQPLFNPQLAEGFTSWDSLLATQLNSSTNQEEFTTSSDNLKSLANYLERQVFTIKNGNNTQAQSKLTNLTIGSATITQSNRTALLPNVDATLSDPNVKTENVKGYYVIVTETDQSGVLVQPVIISLKNGTENPKSVTLKGSTIDITKKITDVYESTTKQAEAGVLKKDTGDSEAYGGTSAVVSKTDIVHYEITARLPKYDSNVSTANIQDFVIKDIASNGITIDPTSIKVYLSGDDESAMTPTDSDTEIAGTRGKSITGAANGNWYLTGATTRNTADYQYTVDTSSGNHSLTITITGDQMRQKLNDNGTEYALSSLNNGATRVSTTAATEDLVISRNQVVKAADMTKPNLAGATTMENMYIVVNYDATVNKTAAGGTASTNADLAFDRSYKAAITNANVTKDMWDAVGEAMTVTTGESTTESVTAAKDLNKQISEAKVLGTTRYNKTYTATDYAWSTFNAFDDDTKTALGKLAKQIDTTLSGSTDKDNFEEFFNTGDKAEEHRIQLLLAKDKYNLTLNGENNRAYMTYGNRYSTGSGVAYDNANYTKLYSVDLKLDKLAERSVLEATPKLKATAEGLAAAKVPALADIAKVDNWVTADDIAKMAEDTTYSSTEKVAAEDEYNPSTGSKAIEDVTVGSTDEKVYACWLAAKRQDAAKAASYDDTDVGGVTELKAVAGWTTANDDQAKLALYFLYAENTRRANQNYYEETADPEKVVGAIFHLVKKYGVDDNGDDQNEVIDLGYAVSDSNGQLRMLQDGSGAADYTYTWTEKVQKKNSEGQLLYIQANETEGTNVTANPVMETVTHTMHLDSTLANNEDSWAMLSVGGYELEEVYAPTGFKKWANKISFTVTANDNGLSGNANEYTGSFGATGGASDGLASIAEKATGTNVTFDYWNTGKENVESNGVLSHHLYNYYLDTLPATGGIGTVLFTAGGIAIVLMAGALFVVYMKKRNAEEE